jgi:uncharacterized membrane protein YtjA (UPF0391 family)
MIRYAAGFLIVALLAAFFGYGGVASTAAEIGKLFFFGFLVLAVVTFIASLFGRSRRGAWW